MNSNNFINDLFSQSVNKVRGISILLVVLGHIATPFTSLIYSFHIPLFFFLSGLFINTSYSFEIYARKNFKRLILPYLIFGLIGLIINVLKNILLHRPFDDFIQSILGFLCWMDIEHLHHYGFVLWFLPALFWGRLIVYTCVKYLGMNDYIVMIILISLSVAISRLPNLPLGIDNGILATPWIAFGFIFNKQKGYLLIHNKALTIFLLLVSFSLYFLQLRMPSIDLATKNIGNPIETIPYTFMVIFLIIYFAYCFAIMPMHCYKIGWCLDKCGTYSLAILVLHPYTNNIAHLVVEYFLNSTYWEFKFMLTILMLMPFILLRERFSGNVFFRYL